MENTVSYTDSSSTLYASASARLKAFLMDVIILLAISFTLGILISMAMGGFDLSQVRLSSIMTISYIAFPITYLAYSVYFESSAMQATIGKQALDIKAVDEDGNQLNLVKALIRNAVKLIVCVGAVALFFTPKKQGLHDIVAKTLVSKNY